MNANDYAINQKFIILFFVVLILFNVKFSFSPSKNNRNLRRNKSLLSNKKPKKEGIAIEQQTFFFNDIDNEYNSMYNPYIFQEKK